MPIAVYVELVGAFLSLPIDDNLFYHHRHPPEGSSYPTTRLPRLPSHRLRGLAAPVS